MLIERKVNSPLVSIIMPLYNSESYLKDTIESVIKQTYKNWQLIIVDDCSTDNSLDIVNQFQAIDNRIISLKMKRNSGAALARNKGIIYSEGKYLAFIDSDDIWFPKKIEKQLDFMLLNNVSFSCTSYSKIDENGNELSQTVRAFKRLDYNGILKHCPGNSTVMYNVEKIGKITIPNIRKRNDYIMWLQVIKQSQILYGLDETLSSHRIRTGSLSGNKISLVKYHWKIYREYEKISMIKSTFLILYWISKTIKEKIRIK